MYGVYRAARGERGAQCALYGVYRLREENEVLSVHNSQLLKQLEQERTDSAVVRSRVRDEWEAEKQHETERLRKMFRCVTRDR